MNKDVLNLLSRQKSFLKMGLLTVFVASGILITHGVGQFDRVGLIKEGTATCFQRVLQSYTAHLLGSTNSQYLTQGFTSTTEQCFGEAIHQAEMADISAASNAVKTLNNLASSTHWFHGHLEARGGETVLESGVTVSDIGERFRNLESLRNDLYTQLDGAAVDLRQRVDFLKALLYSSAILLMIVFTSEMISGHRRRQREKVLEQQARELEDDYIGGHSVNIDAHLFKAMCEAGYTHCAELFNRYIVDLSRSVASQKIVRNEHSSNQELDDGRFPYGRVFSQAAQKGHDQVGPASAVIPNIDKDQQESRIEELWSDWTERDHIIERPRKKSDQLELSAQVKENVADAQRPQLIQKGGASREGVHLDWNLANLVGRFSDRVFSQGVSLELDVDEEIYIQGDEESTQQVLYHLMSGALERISDKISRSTESEDERPKEVLSLKLKRNGPSVVLEVRDTGTSLPERVMTGLDSDVMSESFESELIKNVTLEYRICRELMSEMNGHYTILKEGGENLTKLFFQSVAPAATTTEERAKLVDIKKGTKKELMEELKQPLSHSVRT